MSKPGDSLRDQIAQLLRMKYPKVEVEWRLEATTADVFFVDDTNPIFPRTIAIEAKDWRNGLSSQDLATIYNLYAPSLTNRKIDFLWIVGRRPLSGSPKESLERLGNVRYSTFEEFRASLMNFTGLLTNNSLVFDNGDVSKSFIHTRSRESGRPLVDHVREWITSDNSGLIVYGGYGLGKTTFSQYLASELSKEHQRGDFPRIPIRISLGGMYSKQDLIALICSTLSGGESGATVKDFSYGLFLEMNRQGQYLLILDGFDEMRHAMDLDDFVYTFEEMKPLFADKAKVIMLGRPDSFLSNEEEQRVLSSLFESGLDRKKRLATIEVAFFSKDEISTYLDSYVKSRKQELSENQKKNLDELMNRLPESEDNILSRPVQLKMFTKVMDECLSDDKIMNRYELYSRFIYSFMSREAQKAARQPKSLVGVTQDFRDDRAKFMQAVAWWVITGKKENRFLPDEIPSEIIPSSFRGGQQGRAAIREAIVGSVIEPVSREGVLSSKARKYYFFPHKSYLEFLVSNYFAAGRFSVDEYRLFIDNINNEILSFLEEGPATGIDNLRQGLRYAVGSVDPRIVEACATDSRIVKEVAGSQKSNRHPSQIYTHYSYLRKNDTSEPYLISRLADSSTLSSFASLLNCISVELGVGGSERLASALILHCLTGVPGLLFKEVKNEPKKLYRADTEVFRTVALSRCVTTTEKRVSIDVMELQRLSQSASQGHIYVGLSGAMKNKKVSVESDRILRALQGGVRELVSDLMGRNQRNGSWLPIELLGEAQERFG